MNDAHPMNFEWDEAKSEACFQARGFDFAYAANERSSTMKATRITLDPSNRAAWDLGRIDTARVDTTTEADIAQQAASDEADALQDIAKFARRVRKRLGLSQAEFSDVNGDLKRIQISSCQRFKTDTPPLLNTVRVQPIFATSLPLIIPA